MDIAGLPTSELAIELMQRRSVTPADCGCQEVIAKRLEEQGFKIEHMPFSDVSNLWAVRGHTGPVFAFAGHTDVVPAGNENDWKSPPFEPNIRDGHLFGRGAADMKGSLAAMICATEEFLAESEPAFRLAFLITSDEEGKAEHGTREVIEVLKSRSTHIDYCLVGEPSSTEQVGDTVKIGRRGSLSGTLHVRGLLGHVAYPHLARNAIHLALPALDELTGIQWDEGNDAFPPTTFQVSNLSAGTGANNVIPGVLEAWFNFRFSTETTDLQLRQRVEEILDSHNLDYEIQWHLSGQPFLTQSGQLVDIVSESISRVCGYRPELSTSGGTSDGRFIAPTGSQVLELGPCNATIHKVDECVRLSDLELLKKIYKETLLCLNQSLT